VVDTAAGIHEIVNQNMAAAARMHAVELGADLRGVTLLAFGGAGPVHACGVAELLESDRVIFPVNASVFSAFGTLVSPVRFDLARSMPRRLDAVDPAEREVLLAELRNQGRRVLSAAGIPPSRVIYRYGVDARYLGQGNEVTVWVGEGDEWPASNEEVVAAFEAEYQRIYGLTIPDVTVEAVTWRISAYAPAENIEPEALKSGSAAAPFSSRQVVFGRGMQQVEVPIYRRSELGANASFAGPAIVEERETTVVIRPGWDVEVGADGSLTATRSR
jgi:N-methylhydantoinase A